MSLFAFLFDTVQPRSNDPSNARLWLPGVLAGIPGSGGGKLLPLHQSSWDLGPITGTTGYTVGKAFADNWATYLEKVQHVDLSNQYPIADPAAPMPHLSLGGSAGDVVINGLDNVYVHPAQSITATPTGYQAVLQLELGYYDGTGGRPTLSPLAVNAPYQLEQKLCTSSDGKTCNGNYSTDIVGGGMVSAAITNAWIQATVAVTVTGTGAQRQLAVQITGVALQGPTPGSLPSLALTSLTIDASVSSYLRDVWAQLATQAILSPDGQAGIFASMNATINAPSFLGSLSSTVTSQLASVLDSLVGPVHGNLPSDAGQSAPDPADQYLYDRIRYALDAPASSWYLPRLLCNLTDPRLEPLTISSIGLPPITVSPITFQNVTLSNVVLHGLTNLQTPSDQIVFSASNVRFTALLGALTSPPALDCAGGGGIPLPPATATGNFSMSAEGQTLGGSFTVTARNGTLVGTASAGGTDASDMVITVGSLQIAMSSLAGLTINVEINSAFNQIVNNLLNQPGPQQAILDGLNQALAAQLAAIGPQVTAYARRAIAQQLA